MRALRLTGPGRVGLVEAAAPRPRAGQVLVRVAWAGICATDRELVGGAFPGQPDGLIPGHEIGGTIVTSAGGRPAVGARVIVRPDLRCNGCDRGDAAGWPTPHVGELGFDHDGGWADLVVANADQCIPVADAIADRDIPLIEPLVCPAGALDTAPGGVGGRRVAVVGSGVAAANFAQSAWWLGATGVFAFVTRPERAALFASAAAEPTLGGPTIGGRTPDGLTNSGPAAAGLTNGAATNGGRTNGGPTAGGLTTVVVTDVMPGPVWVGGFDVAVDSVGSEASLAATIGLLRPGGVAVWYGLRSPSARIPVRDVVLRNLTIVGRTNADPAMWPRVIAAIADGDLRLTPADRTLTPDDVPDYLGAPPSDVKAVIDFR